MPAEQADFAGLTEKLHKLILIENSNEFQM